MAVKIDYTSHEFERELTRIVSASYNKNNDKKQIDSSEKVTKQEDVHTNIIHAIDDVLASIEKQYINSSSKKYGVSENEHSRFFHCLLLVADCTGTYLYLHQ